ncbi:MAG TPA: SAM-dependent methyltransferase [Polyangiales bacterium]|jgi:methyltransferase (TIGR00027 family)
MSDTLIAHVSDTAFWVASYRAAESARPDALFHDPLAARLADARGRDIAARIGDSKQIAWVVVIRTLIIDDYIREAIAAGCDTVLNLGAGLDTRPYRLELPPTLRWIEVDFAATIDFKNERLAGETPRCRLERRAVDLGDATARRALLDDVDGSRAKVIVLTEGVVGYLPNDAVAALAADLHARPRIAHWVLEYTSAGFRKIERIISHRRRKQMANAPIQFDPGDWRAFFAERGWTAKEIRFFMPEAERHGRPAPVSPWMKLALRLITLNNPSVMRENLGFALMERRSVAE